MKPPVDRAEPRLVDMRVDLRRAQAGVAEHFLNGAQVGPAPEQVGRKGMTQEMRPDALLDARRAWSVSWTICQSRAVVRLPAMFAEEDFAARAGLDQFAAGRAPEPCVERRRPPFRRPGRPVPCRPCPARAGAARRAVEAFDPQRNDLARRAGRTRKAPRAGRGRASRAAWRETRWQATGRPRPR